MQITDVTDELADARASTTFPELIAGGARARAHRAARLRRRLRHAAAQDQRGAVAEPHRARRARRRSATSSPSRPPTSQLAKLAKKGASAEVGAEAAREGGSARRTTPCWSASTPEVPTAMAMGILRLEMGKELKLVDERACALPLGHRLPALRVGRGREGRYASLHHPFTAPLDEDARAARHRARARCGPRPTTSS